MYKTDPDVGVSLSDRWITAITEDADGYLWIGTRQGGLNRYDPRLETFVRYIHADENPNSLNNDHINMLYRDHENNIWIGTPEGLDLYDKTQNNFKHYLSASNELESANKNKITAMFQDNRGQLWVGTAGNGLKKFDARHDTFETYQSNSENSNTISFDYITAIVEDDHSIVWVGTRNGLNRFDPTTGRFDRFLRPSANVESPLPDNNATSESETIQTINVTYSIPTNSTNTLHVDSTNNLWVGTANGLNRYEPAKGFIHYYNDPTVSKSMR